MTDPHQTNNDWISCMLETHFHIIVITAVAGICICLFSMHLIYNDKTNVDILLDTFICFRLSLVRDPETRNHSL